MQLRIYTQPALFRLLLLIFCCLFRRPHARPFDDSAPFWIIQHLLLTVVAAVTALFNRDAAVSRAIPYTRSANFDRNDSRTDDDDDSRVSFIMFARSRKIPDVGIYFANDTRIAEILNSGLGEEFSKI